MARPSSFIPRELTVTISAIGGLGDGISRVDGKPVYVPKSTGGDELAIRITSETKEFARGEIIQIIKPGKDRVTAPCPHYAECGGCSLQHLTEESYQQFKRDVVTQAIGYSSCIIAPNFHFLKPNIRRRTEFKVADGRLCYHGLRSHKLVPIHTCLIVEPEIDALIAPINAELSHFPHTTHVKVTSVDGNIGVTFYAADKVIKTMPLTITLGGHSVSLPDDAFLQASSEAQQIMTRLVVDGVRNASSVVDLFCGIGTYSLPVSNRAKVHALEFDTGMVDALKKIAHVSAEKRDLFKNPLPATELKKFDAAIINPPRAGAKTQVEQLAASGIKKIAMVSCNPSTWARDAKMLKDGGYRLESLDAIDQFVWSPHIELVSIFVR